VVVCFQHAHASGVGGHDELSQGPSQQESIPGSRSIQARAYNKQFVSLVKAFDQRKSAPPVPHPVAAAPHEENRSELQPPVVLSAATKTHTRSQAGAAATAVGNTEARQTRVHPAVDYRGFASGGQSSSNSSRSISTNSAKKRRTLGPAGGGDTDDHQDDSDPPSVAAVSLNEEEKAAEVATTPAEAFAKTAQRNEQHHDVKPASLLTQLRSCQDVWATAPATDHAGNAEQPGAIGAVANSFLSGNYMTAFMQLARFLRPLEDRQADKLNLPRRSHLAVSISLLEGMLATRVERGLHNDAGALSLFKPSWFDQVKYCDMMDKALLELRAETVPDCFAEIPKECYTKVVCIAKLIWDFGTAAVWVPNMRSVVNHTRALPEALQAVDFFCMRTARDFLTDADFLVFARRQDFVLSLCSTPMDRVDPAYHKVAAFLQGSKTYGVRPRSGRFWHANPLHVSQVTKEKMGADLDGDDLCIPVGNAVEMCRLRDVDSYEHKGEGRNTAETVWCKLWAAKACNHLHTLLEASAKANLQLIVHPVSNEQHGRILIDVYVSETTGGPILSSVNTTVIQQGMHRADPTTVRQPAWRIDAVLQCERDAKASHNGMWHDWTPESLDPCMPSHQRLSLKLPEK
jgi:hypothetical protein